MRRAVVANRADIATSQEAGSLAQQKRGMFLRGLRLRVLAILFIGDCKEFVRGGEFRVLGGDFFETCDPLFRGRWRGNMPKPVAQSGQVALVVALCRYER